MLRPRWRWPGDWFFPAAARQERGFSLLLFNYRGFGMSDGDTESEATLTFDAEAAMQYLTAKRGIAPDDIVIAGISLGAPVAATLAARSPCRHAQYRRLGENPGRS